MITQFIQFLFKVIKQNTCFHKYKTIVARVDNCYPSSWEECEKCGYIRK